MLSSYALSYIVCTRSSPVFIYLSLAGHFVSELRVLVHEVYGEGVVVLPPEDVGATGLPEEGVAGGHPDAVPEFHQVQPAPLGYQHRLRHGTHLSNQTFWNCLLSYFYPLLYSFI